MPNTQDFETSSHWRSAAPTWLALLVAAWAAAWPMVDILEWPAALVFGLPLGACALSFGAQSGRDTWRRRCETARTLVILVWILAGASLGWRWSMQSGGSDFLMEAGNPNGNLGRAVTIAMGLVLVLSLMTAGDGRGEHSRTPIRGSFWSRPLIPWRHWSPTVPLAILLPFFIVLLVVNNDQITLYSFALFASASLFAVAYERSRWNTLHEVVSQNDAKLQNHFLLRREMWPAVRHLASTMLWMLPFAIGGAILHGPLMTILMRESGRGGLGESRVGVALLGLTPNPRRSEDDATAQFDWRGSSRVMELRGGPHLLSQRLMMTVQVNAGQPSGLWRGRVLDTYSGKWESTINSVEVAHRGVIFNRSLWLNFPQIIGTPTGREDLFAVVREAIEPNTFFVPQLFASGVITRALGRSRVRWQPDSGAAEANPSGQRSYEVESRVPRIDEALLSQARGLSAREADQWRRNPTIAPTLRGPQRTQTQRQLALLDQEFVAWSRAQNKPLDSPWRRANALRDWLGARCTYSLNAPVVPIAQDPTLFFLSDSRRGACDLFASALALMLRQQGVPARLATGYLQPESADPNNPKRWLVRETQAHAWVELWTPQFGWLPFDATVGTRQDRETNADRRLSWPALSATSLLIGSGALLLLIGAVWQWIDTRSKHLRIRNVAPESAARAAIEAAYAQAARLIARRVPRVRQQTIREYQSQVSASGLPAALKSDFALLSNWLERARYDRVPPSLDAAELRAVLQRMRASD